MVFSITAEMPAAPRSMPAPISDHRSREWAFFSSVGFPLAIRYVKPAHIIQMTTATAAIGMTILFKTAVIRDIRSHVAEPQSNGFSIFTTTVGGVVGVGCAYMKNGTIKKLRTIKCIEAILNFFIPLEFFIIYFV